MGELVAFPGLPREGYPGDVAEHRGAEGVDRAEARRTEGIRSLSHDGTLYDYIDKYTRGRIATGEVSRDTAHDQRLTLYEFAASFGLRQIRMLGESDVIRWLESIGHNRPSTRRKKLSVVRLFCRWLVRKGYVRRDPCMDVRGAKQPRTVPQIFGWDEISLLLDAANDRGVLAILLGLQMGLRCGEIVRLELGDVGDTQALVTGKGHHQRYVPLVRQVRWALDAYLSVRGTWAGPLIENEQTRGHGISSHALTVWFGRLCVAAGVKQHANDGRSFHTLRRTCATHLADRGMPLLEVAEFLGHVNMETTRLHYARANARKLASFAEGRWYGGVERTLEVAG